MAALALAFGPPPSARAATGDVINVNCGRASTTGSTLDGSASGTTVAPFAYSGTKWNDVYTPPYNLAINGAVSYAAMRGTLNNSNGTATTVGFLINGGASNGGAVADWAPAGNLTMFKACWQGDRLYATSGSGITLTLVGLDSQKSYDLYIVSGMHGTGNRNGSFTTTNPTDSTQPVTNTCTQVTSFVEGNNYVRLTNVKPDDGVIYIKNAPTTEKIISGFQLVEVATIQNQSKNMLTFGTTGLPAVISGSNISWDVPYATELATLAPTFTFSANATCNKTSGAIWDFSGANPQTCTVTAEDGSTKVYTVTVTKYPASFAKVINVALGNRAAAYNPSSPASSVKMNGTLYLNPFQATLETKAAPLAYYGTTWNDAVSSSGNPLTKTNLLDSTGTATPVGYTLSQYKGQANDHGGIDVMMLLSGGLQSSGPLSSGSSNPDNNSLPTLTLTGLQDFRTYDLCVISCLNYNGQSNTYNVGGTLDTTTANNPLITGGTDITIGHAGVLVSTYHTSWQATKNYGTFTGLSSSGGSITMRDKSLSGNFSLNGFQLVEHPATGNELLALTIPNGTTTITGTQVVISMPAGTDVTALVPTCTVSAGATTSPASGTSRDFTTPQSYTVTADDGSTRIYQVTVNVTSAPGELHHFAISTIATPQTAGTAIDGITLTAQDLNNDTVPGFTGTVTFGGTAGVTGTSAAFTAGVLSGVSVTPTAVGSARTLTVSRSGVSGSRTFDVNPGPPTATHSTVTASPGSVTADGVTTATITVTLIDAFANPVAGKTVVLASNRGATDTISAASGPSGSNGTVTFTVKSATTGAPVFTASDTTDGVTLTQTATVTFMLGGTSAANSTVVATPTAVTADGVATSTITVTLKDANSNAVAGKTVTLASSRGATDTISAASGSSGSNGIVTFTVKSTTAGAPVFTATNTTDSVGIIQTASVTFTAGAVATASSSVVAAPSSVKADGSSTSTITVTLKDATGNAVAGKTVTLASSRGTTDTISAASGSSGSNGTVTFTVKSSTVGAPVFTATDTTDSIVLTQTATVTFYTLGAGNVINCNAGGTNFTKYSYDPSPSTTASRAAPLPYVGNVWNNMSHGGSIANLKDTVGVNSGISATLSGFNYTSGDWNGLGSIAMLHYGWLKGPITTSTWTGVLTFSGLNPAHHYSLALPSDHNDSEGSSFQIAGYGIQTCAVVNKYQTTDWSAGLNYVLFSNLVAPTGTLEVQCLPKNSPSSGSLMLNGFQLVDNDAVTPLSPNKDILSFNFPALGAATISGTNISIDVLWGTPVSALAPTYTLPALATGSPASGSTTNFTNPVAYTTTGQDGSTKIYQVSVNILPKSSAKDILTCDFGALGSAVIAGSNITLTVPLSQSVTSLAPTFTLSPFATLSPASGSAHDFTNPVTYTVTAQDGSTQLYTVAVPSYGAWQQAASLYLLTTPDGANLPAGAAETHFPMLLRLNSNNFDFSQAKTDGADLRFTTTAGMALPYQIEKWDAAAGTASIWVKIPSITGNARQEIRMYWGKSDALAESNGSAVFNPSNGYASVIHLTETLADEVGTVTPVNVGSTMATGMIGQGRHFTTGTAINCGTAITTYPYSDQSFTTEAWLRPEVAGTGIVYWGRYATRYNGNTGDGNEVGLNLASPSGLYWASDGPGGATATTKPIMGQWYHVAATYGNGTSQIFVNGQLEGTSYHAAAMSIVQNIQMTIGGMRSTYNYSGDIDEVRVSRVARSANWMKLQYENQKPLQTLVGPPVQSGSTFAVAPTSVTMLEGATTTLTAQAGGAQSLYWIRQQNAQETIIAANQFTLPLAAGRVTGSQAYSIQLKAVYPTEVKTINIPVTITEDLPDPLFTLTAPTTWDGRQTITVTPNITNQAAMAAKGVGTLSYSWSVAGLAVTKQTSGGTLTLTRSQGSGPLTVNLTIDNGGTPVTITKTITVQEPASDVWVQRTPDANEKPVNNQFFARDDTGFGTIYYNGTQAGSPDGVFLQVYTTETGSDVPYGNIHRQTLTNGSYAFTVPIAAGLVKYKVVFGTTRGGIDTVDSAATVTNLVCGDAYIVDGQSNAVADNADNPYSSEWIRSYGNMGGGTASGWGNAVRGIVSGDSYRIGYWPMELAINLVATYNVPVCIINGAVGGTLISQHQANPADHYSAGGSYSIYANIVTRVAAAKLTHGIRAILWHQGENNSGAAAPTGDYDYKSYQQYFMDMAAAWKQDYPNIKHYYVYQVWPLPCSMGPKGDQLREVQRTLPGLFSNLSVMSTLGVTNGSRGLCHFDSAGYTQLAAFMAPLVKQYSYGTVPATPVSAPNLQRAYFTSAAKTAIALEFDQDMAWTSANAANIYLDQLSGKVASGTVSGKTITLQLSVATTTSTITYLMDQYWDGSSGKLFGANGIAALTFADVTINATPPSDPFAAWIGTITFPAGADKTATGDPDHDGMNNQQEFAFGLDPTNGSSANPIQAPLDKTSRSFSYTRRVGSGLGYSVWTSTNLLGWTEDTTATQQAGSPVGGVETVVVTLTNPLPAGSNLFVRVRAQ